VTISWFGGYLISGYALSLAAAPIPFVGDVTAYFPETLLFFQNKAI
jgi:hypothetical protein